MMEFSVIIPWHKNAALLERAVESVVGQTHPAGEIVIICNGPGQCDGAAVANRFSGEKVKVIAVAEANANLARNAGIDAAAFAFCAFLDCDDEFSPDRLAKDAEFLRRHPDRIVASQGIRMRGGGTSWHFPARPPETGAEIGDYILGKGNFILTSALSMPVDIARRVRFDPAVSKFQDLDFLLRAQWLKIPVSVDLRPGYLYHDAGAEDRLSSGDRYGVYAEWIGHYPYISDRARAAFLSRAVAQHDLPANFIRNVVRILRGSLFGGVPVSDSVLMLGQKLVPARLRNILYEKYFISGKFALRRPGNGG
jgi:glycosyltransferase involved in cell wall biosynthesis